MGQLPSPRCHRENAGLAVGWKKAGKHRSREEDLQVSLVEALLPEERPPGRSNSQRGGRHGPGESACRANAAGTQGGRAHAAPASLQATTNAAAAAAAADADGRPDELYQATTGVGHRVIRSSIFSSSVHAPQFPTRHSRAIRASIASPRCADATRPRISTSLHRVPLRRVQTRLMLRLHVTGRSRNAYLHG